MISLKDKRFLVTGGTTDVGRSLTLALSRYGADIAIADKNPEKAQRIINEINESREIKEDYGRAAFIEADLTIPGNAKEAVSRAAETFGGIDILICGLYRSYISKTDGDDYLKEFERLVDINLKSAIYTAHAVIPFMKGRKRGKIIFLVPDMVRFGAEGESLTSATRGGLIYYARALARELAPSNIAVNCVAMGPTEDYLISRDPQAGSIRQAEVKLKDVIPMGRVLRGEEITQTIVFLSSSAADAVTGQTWAVNGGLTMF